MHMIWSGWQWRIQTFSRGPHHMADPDNWLGGQFNVFLSIHVYFLLEGSKSIAKLNGSHGRIFSSAAASIWFEIWGSWIRVRQISIFPGKFPKNFDFFHAISQKNFNFSRQIYENFWFFQAISQKIRLSRQELPIYSNFWKNYSISLEKSPLSNILPVHNLMKKKK